MPQDETVLITFFDGIMAKSFVMDSKMCTFV